MTKKPLEKKPLSILMISDDFRPAMTGVGVHLANLSETLIRRGYRVSVVTTRRRNEPAEETWNGIRIYRVFTLKVYGFYQALPSDRTIRDIIRKERPDIIHHHYFGLMMKKVCAIAESLSIPQISTYHFSAHVLVQPLFMRPFRTIIERQIVEYENRCDLVIVPSKNLIERLRLDGIKTPKRFIPNAVVLEESTRTDPLHDPATFSILYTGRLAAEKNVSLLISAHKKLLESVPKARLDIIGTGPMKELLIRQAETLGIGDRVRFLGFVEHASIAQHYAGCDLFVLPSIEEVQPISAIEAMWFKKPIIVTSAIASSDELVERGLNGYIVDPESPEELAERILTIASDPALREKMGAASWEKAQKYRPDRMVDAVETAYRDVLLERSRGVSS